MNFIWLDVASSADYFYIFFIGINAIFFNKSREIYQNFYKILESLYYILYSFIKKSDLWEL